MRKTSFICLSFLELLHRAVHFFCPRSGNNSISFRSYRWISLKDNRLLTISVRKAISFSRLDKCEKCLSFSNSWKRWHLNTGAETYKPGGVSSNRNSALWSNNSADKVTYQCRYPDSAAVERGKQLSLSLTQTLFDINQINQRIKGLVGSLLKVNANICFNFSRKTRQHVWTWCAT